MLANQDTNSIDFLQDFKLSFLAEEIYVYTPKGDVKMLPSGSSALDFAFAIHTAVGEKCIGAKVNHKLVPIGHQLRSGDQVEIITSTKQKPKNEWLKLVVTTKAKQKIKDSLKEEKRKIAEEGKGILHRKLDGMGVLMSQPNLEEIITFYKLNSALDLWYDISIKKIDLKELKDFQVTGDKIFAPKIAKVPVE
jgi:GTP pyrophosphokinase